MNPTDYSFHDAVILEVRELCGQQTIEMLLDFPVDWSSNRFEHRILRFKGVTNYSYNEGPFIGNPVILELNDPVEVAVNVLFDNSLHSYQLEIVTNAGKRRIEYEGWELIETHLVADN